MLNSRIYPILFFDVRGVNELDYNANNYSLEHNIAWLSKTVIPKSTKQGFWSWLHFVLSRGVLKRLLFSNNKKQSHIGFHALAKSHLWYFARLGFLNIKNENQNLSANTPDG